MAPRRLIALRWPRLLKALSLALIFMPLVATGGSYASGSSTTKPIYLFKIVISTTSGWTNLLIKGIDPLMTHLSVIAGGDIPGFWCHFDNGYLTSNGASEAQPVEIDIDELTFAGSQSAQFSSSKGDIGVTTVTVYRLASGSWLQLRSFTNSGTNPQDPGVNTRTFTIDPSLLYASPSSTATIEPMPPALRRMVFAFYYPWYLTLGGPGGMTWHTDDGYAHHPLFGRYDSADERIIEAHIEMAKAAGIDGFIANFNGIGIPDEEALPALFRKADSMDFTITFYECADRLYLTANDVVDELSYIIQTYSSHKSFLKVNGMPVIFVYAVGAGNRGPSFWSDVAEGLRSKVGPAYLIGDLGLSPDPNFAEAFDGLHWYGAPDTTAASQAFDLEENMRLGLKDTNWDQAIALILQGRSLPLEEKFLAFTVEPGYDHTKIGGTLYLDRRDGQTYEEFWQIALSKNPDGILVCTWNEWHEGTEIEPSTEYGFAYLNLTRQYTSLYKGTEQPVNSSTLRIRTDLVNVVRYGMRNAALWINNDSPNVQAVYVNLSISLSEGLNLTRVNHSAFYSYVERGNPRTYNVLIPLLKPGETIPFNITLAASVGTENLNVTATGYSPSGVVTTFSIAREVQVVYDRVVIDLEASTSRVEVGSEAPITMRAYYAYDRQPFSGTIHLNDTLTKGMVGIYGYGVSSIEDKKYGLTAFTTNEVYVVFDRIKIVDGAALRSRIHTGSSTITWFKAIYEYDGTVFDPSKGVLYVNGSAASWNEREKRWEISTDVYGDPTKRSYVVTGVHDEAYGITAINDATGPLTVIWYRPAEFLVTDLKVSPTEAQVDEVVTISIKMLNAGEEEGSHTVALKINEMVEDVRTVTLQRGESMTIAFTVVKEVAGAYSVEVNGLESSFTVEAISPRFPWEPYGITIVAVLIAVTIVMVIVWRRRKPGTANQVGTTGGQANRENMANSGAGGRSNQRHNSSHCVQ